MVAESKPKNKLPRTSTTADFRADIKDEDLQQHIKEWLELYNDKCEVKHWRKKLQKIASLLNNPKDEERLKTKIKKYLEEESNHFSEGDDDNVEFRRQLPSYIITKLKKMYLETPNRSKVECTEEMPKYFSRCMMNNLKNVLINWLENISLNKKDLLDRPVKKESILNHITNKLEPLVLVRPKCDSDYRAALNFMISGIVNDLPLAVATQNKGYYLTYLKDTLVKDILSIDAKIPTTYIQPTVAEIKRFVKEQIRYLLDKTHTTINAKRMETLETVLIDHLLTLTDINDIDNDVIDDISNILKNIVELPKDKAKYFTNIIMNDYKEFFFRQHYFNNKKSKGVRSDICSTTPNEPDSIFVAETHSEEDFIQRLVDEIDKWFTNNNIGIKDAISKNTVVKDIACDIVDRLKYLQINPHNKGTDLGELEHFKYQIFKRTKHDTVTKEHIKELMDRIKQIPKPRSFNTGNNLTGTRPPLIENNFKPYVENLIDEIDDWFHKLPLHMYSLENTRLNRESMKIFVEDIEECIHNNDFDTIDQEIDRWIKKVFNRKLNKIHVDKLKNTILSSTFCEKTVLKQLKKELRQEKIFVRYYQDIVDEWIDTLPLELAKDGSFNNIRNKFVHELARKIYNMKLRSRQVPNNDINMKLREEIFELMKKLPLNPLIDEQYGRDYYAEKLVNSLQSCDKKNLSTREPENLELKIVASKLESAILDWLGKLPFYRSKEDVTEDHKLVIKELAKELYKAIEDGDSVDDIIINHLSKLKNNQSKKNVYEVAVQLKQYLRGYFGNILLPDNENEESLELYVEQWLSKLPINIKYLNDFRNKKANFIKSISQLKLSGASNARIIREIIKFMKTLPIDISKKLNDRYLYGEAHYLIQSWLDRNNLKDIDPHDNHDIIIALGSTIKDWVKLLPMKSLYNPRELRSLIDEMTSVINNRLKQSSRQPIEKQRNDMKEEIMKFLRRFPLRKYRTSEQLVSEIADSLVKTLKGRHLAKDDYTEADNVTLRNVAVYGVSVKNTSSNKTIITDEINSNVETYTKQIVHEINDWLAKLNLPQTSDEGFRGVVISDLAGGIVDRHKYLALNPQSQRSPEDELEQLKYQVFKLINKLVGDDYADTPKHAEDLLRRIQSIPVPMLIKPENISISPVAQTENQHPKAAIYQKYQNIFREKVYALPIDTATPDSAQLAQLARIGIYNGIMKTIFRLKADPEFENDYGYFELMLEDRLDEMIDLLPQTDEMKKIRHGWKIDILGNAMSMLKELQGVSDRQSFKQRLKDGFNRKFARNFELEQCFLLQQGFLAEMADAYILETKYMEEDSIKANIYKQRLMKKIDELANHLVKKHNTEFRYLKKPQLAQQAMKVLDSVPIPNDDILNDEVQEILLADEIEQWYKELPITPYVNEFDQVFRKRMMELLAKKLYDIEKNENKLDTSRERLMKHEMSKFLVERGRLVRDEDLNINFMVDELTNRIKNRKHKDASCSNFSKLDNSEILAPLVNSTMNTNQTMRNRSYQAPDQTQAGPQYQSMTQGQFHPQIYPRASTSQGVPFQWPAPQDRNVQDVHKSHSPQRSFRGMVETGRIDQFGQSFADRSTNRNMAQSRSSRVGSPLTRGSPIQQRRVSPEQSPRGSNPYKSNLDNGQMNASREYNQQRQSIQRLMSPKGDRERNQVTQNGRRQPRRNREDSHSSNLNQEIVQEYDPGERQRRFRTNYEEVQCPAYFEDGTKAQGNENDIDLEEEEERTSMKCRCMEEEEERTSMECRCLERKRRRRRICLDSYPCPNFKSPSRYCYI